MKDMKNGVYRLWPGSFAVVKMVHRIDPFAWGRQWTLVINTSDVFPKKSEVHFQTIGNMVYADDIEDVILAIREYQHPTLLIPTKLRDQYDRLIDES